MADIEDVQPVNQSDADVSTGPPQKRTQGGWATSFSKKLNTEQEDVRLIREDVESEVVPVIPDLEAIIEEDLTTQMAEPPSAAATRVTTYKQLNYDLTHQAGLFTLDGNIDLKALAASMAPEEDVKEEDKLWDWEKLFAEMSGDIKEVWSRISDKHMNMTKSNSGTSDLGIYLPGKAM